MLIYIQVTVPLYVCAGTRHHWSIFLSIPVIAVELINTLRCLICHCKAWALLKPMANNYLLSYQQLVRMSKSYISDEESKAVWRTDVDYQAASQQW